MIQNFNICKHYNIKSYYSTLQQKANDTIMRFTIAATTHLLKIVSFSFIIQNSICCTFQNIFHLHTAVLMFITFTYFRLTGGGVMNVTAACQNENCFRNSNSML